MGFAFEELASNTLFPRKDLLPGGTCETDNQRLLNIFFMCYLAFNAKGGKHSLR